MRASFAPKFPLVLTFLCVALPAAAQVAPLEVKAPMRDPRVSVLFEQSLKAYRKLQGLRLFTRAERVIDQGQSRAELERFEWKRPYFSRWQPDSNNPRFVSISDGRFLVRKSTAGMGTATREEIASRENRRVVLGDPILCCLLSGKNPLERFSAVSSTAQLSLIAPAMKAGERCEGVRIVERAGPHNQLRTRTVWFDAQTHFLRVIEDQITSAANGKAPSISTDTWFERVELNPRFAPDTFALPPAPAPVEAPDGVHWSENLRVGQMAPAVEGLDLNGRKQSLAAMRGQVVVVDFWAMWCGPCIHDFERVTQLRRRIDRPTFQVLGVSLDLDKATPIQFLREHKIAVPTLFDGQAMDGANAKRYGLSAIPFKIVVGKEGRIAYINPELGTVEAIVRAELEK